MTSTPRSPHRRTRFHRAVLALAAAAVLVPLSAGTAAARTPQPELAEHRLTVTALDDAYGLSTTRLEAGLTAVTLHDAGSQPHQAQIAHLVPGATAEQFTADVQAGDVPHAMALIAGYDGGPAVVLPGASQTTLQVLQPGRYLVLCFVPDAMAPHLPHFAMGMVAGFTVAPADDDDRPGTALRGHRQEVAAVDEMRFVVPPVLRTHSLVRFDNRSTMDTHEFALARLHSGATVADVIAWARTQQGPPPYDPMGGAGGTGPGGTVQFALDLPPGTYIAVCLVPDDETGVAHAAYGMVVPVQVVR